MTKAILIRPCTANVEIRIGKNRSPIFPPLLLSLKNAWENCNSRGKPVRIQASCGNGASETEIGPISQSRCSRLGASQLIPCLGHSRGEITPCTEGDQRISARKRLLSRNGLTKQILSALAPAE